MLNIDLLVMTHEEIMLKIASNVENRRKQYRLTQKQLSLQAGVAYSSYRRFEQTGHISLDSFVKIARVLDCEKELLELFTKRHYNSIQEVLDEKRR